MKFKIAERLKPFDHTPGVHCLLPGSLLSLQIFPTLLRIHDLSTPSQRIVEDLLLSLQGPVRDFTVEQDLERGWVRVWGFTPRGYFRYRLQASQEKGFALTLEKEPEGGLDIKALHYKPTFQAKTLFFGAGTALYVPPATDRLSLGNHKQADWTLLQRRQDLREIFPLWLRLGQLIPVEEASLTLFDQCHQTIALRRHDELDEQFLSIFLACFHGMLVPKLIDEQHQGIPLPFQAPFLPLHILSEGAKLIRSLFVKTKESEITILPSLPPELHCGRFLSVTCGALGKLDLEWSKKTVRRMRFIAAADSAITFRFQSGLKQFRVRRNENDKGIRLACDTPLPVAQGHAYLFDKFMH